MISSPSFQYPVCFRISALKTEIRKQTGPFAEKDRASRETGSPEMYRLPPLSLFAGCAAAWSYLAAWVRVAQSRASQLGSATAAEASAQ